jgi:GTPase SAR1 family protein
MNPLTLDLSGKNIVVIGPPAAGKTTLALQLSRIWPQHRLVGGFTGLDGYMNDYDFEAALYAILDDISVYEEQGHNMILEGVQGYRLLRKGLELDLFYPDIVLELRVTEAQVRRVYAGERTGKNVERALGMAKGLQTVLNEYRAMSNPKPPEWYVIESTF